MKKSEIIASIEKMPDEISIDELMEQLFILQKIEAAREQVKEGKVYTEEVAKDKLEKWMIHEV